MKLTAFKGRTGFLDFYVSMMYSSQLSPVFNSFFSQAELAVSTGEDSAYERAQRLLNMPHVRKILKYMDRDVRFFSSPSAAGIVSEKLIDAERNLYEIEVSEPYLFDGQKRVKASIMKHEANPDFNDNIAVLFVNTDSLQIKQQLFTDTNNTPAKVSPSLSLIYNHESSLSKFIPDMVPAHLLEVDKTSVSKVSSKLLTPKIAQEALGILFGVSVVALESIQYEKLVAAWREYQPYVEKLFKIYDKLNDLMAFSQLRDQSILPHNVTLLSIMKLIPLAHQQGMSPDFLDRIIDLHLDGSTNRTNSVWDGRCISFGALKKSSSTIDKTAAMLGYMLKIQLPVALDGLVMSGGDEHNDLAGIDMMN